MSSIAERLSETAKRAGVSNVYGDPVELNGITIVPVAISFHSFGGGSGNARAGEGASSGGEGEGGGGISAAAPIGAYVRDIRGLRFEPNLITLLAVGVPFLWVAGRIVTKLAHIAAKAR